MKIPLSMPGLPGKLQQSKRLAAWFLLLALLGLRLQRRHPQVVKPQWMHQRLSACRMQLNSVDKKAVLSLLNATLRFSQRLEAFLRNP